MDIAKIRKKIRLKQTETKVEETPAAPLLIEENGERALSGLPVADLPVTEPAGAVETLPVADITSVETTDTPGKTEEAEETILELLTFSLSREEFAFRLPEVEEIVRYQRITKVPAMPDYVLGITSLRGKIIPVIDLMQRLIRKGPPAENRDDAGADEMHDRNSEKENGKILIISGPEGLIGACVERVIGVVRFRKDAVLGPPANLTEDERKYIEGVVIIEKRFISVVRASEALKIEVS